MTTQTTKEFDKLRAQVEKKLAAKVKPKKPIIECDVCDWWHDDAGCCRDDACLYEGADE